MRIQNYFDLSQPVNFRKLQTRPASVDARPSPPEAELMPQLSIAWQIGLYLLVMASILAGRFMDLYRAGVAGDFALDWRYLLFVVLVSTVVFPTIYDKARFNRDQPVLVQIIVIFTAGMGWEKILSTVTGR